MKAMNYLVCLMFIMLGVVSCSQKELPEEELTSNNFSYRLVQEPKYLNGLELYKLGTIHSLSVMKQEIAELKEAIDVNKGGKRLIPRLEQAQKEEAGLNMFKSGLVSIVMPRGGKFPPRPPRGCFDNPRAGCVPKINISDFSGIELPAEVDDAEITIVNEKNKVVAKGGSATLTKTGNRVVAIEGDFKGNATMVIKMLRTKEFGDAITLELPVYKN
ncbi:hypothetical protein [Zobellia sp. 1_MG-2023]|uniref:hypothetical protein n=1 Tax=Zobellia sp. 1_MG-2023 TaxID=3062626 RepID=UPI0026E2C09F|nr:hypothetical protein [Zobellia sp. 1_MG-2023]MDO6818302.1 hypothetical protein [Zobellia sp. 1_MG-2023]